MKKLLTLAFLISSFVGLSQVATKTAQDTSNARLSLIKNLLYKISKSTTVIQHYSFDLISSNTGTTYSIGNVITNNTLSPQNVSIPGLDTSATYEVCDFTIVYNGTVVATIDVNVYSASVNSGNDGTTYNPKYSEGKTMHNIFRTTTSVQYGNFIYSDLIPFLGSSLTSQVGGSRVVLSPSSTGKLYFHLTARSSFTPISNQEYHLSISFLKTNKY